MLNFGQLLTRRAHVSPNREAFVDSQSGDRLTFQQLDEGTNRIANCLLDSGVKPGDRVALLLMNSVEFLESYFGIAKIGGVIVPLNWRLTADELEFILHDSGCTVMIGGEEFLDTLSDLHARGDRTAIEQWLLVGNSPQHSHFTIDYTTLTGQASAEEPPMGGMGDDTLYIRVLGDICG